MEDIVAGDTAPGKRYVRMTIGGMGNLSASPDVLVMLLIPESETSRPIRETMDQIFPVPLRPPVGQNYFHRLVQVLRQGPETEGLLYSFLTASATELLSLHVTSQGDRISTRVKLRDRAGLIKSFTVFMEDALVQSVLLGVPIFVDEEILRSIRSQVSFHVTDAPMVGPMPDPERKQSPIEMISDFIRSGSRPEEMEEEMRNNVQVMLPRQWAELSEIAIETENYEWASYLRDLEETHPSDKDEQP